MKFRVYPHQKVHFAEKNIEDLLILLRRISTATHKSLGAYDLVDPERVLYGFWKGTGAAADIEVIKHQLKTELQRHVAQHEINQAENLDLPWPPPRREPLPANPDDEAIRTLASGLSVHQLLFGILASLNGLVSAYRRLGDYDEVAQADVVRMELLVGDSWQVFWKVFFGEPIPDQSTVTDTDKIWLQKLTRTTLDEATTTAGQYLSLIVPALSDGLNAVEKPTAETYIRLTRVMLKISRLGAENEEADPTSVLFIPGAKGYDRAACRLAWGDIRWIARDMLNANELEDVYYSTSPHGSPIYDCYQRLSGAVHIYAPPLSETSPDEDPRWVGTERHVTACNKATCDDYSPGDLKMPKATALHLYRKVVTLSQVVGLILAEYDEGNFEQEYFRRSNACDDYDEIWSTFYYVDTLERRHWPKRCSGQAEVQLQMSGEFSFDWKSNPSYEWWGGWADPEPTEYCVECDPDGLYGGWKPTLGDRVRAFAGRAESLCSRAVSLASRSRYRLLRRRKW